MYLENLVGIHFVHLETLNCHKTSYVFPVAHFCVPTMTANLSDVYEFLLEDIRGGYDGIGSADLGKKPQTPLPEFAIEA